jgi:VanZ family protein
MESWPLWAARLALAGWWALMFAGTHIPPRPSLESAPVNDKVVHFLMYAVLGALLPLWDGWRRLSPRRLAEFFAILSLYAVADELLQIPVGRTADWRDGLADLAGAAAGLAVAMAVREASLKGFMRRPLRDEVQ